MNDKTRSNTISNDVETAINASLNKTEKSPNPMRYSPTTHAFDRIRLRFGVGADLISEWVNDKMNRAELIRKNDKGQCEYLSEGVRFIVDGNTIVTAYNEVSTGFLKPVLEREMRRIRREHTKIKRQVEMDHALSLQKYAEMAVNKAKARNPETRELIAERMKEVQAVVDGYQTRLERMKDDYKQKIRAVELISK